MQPLVRAALAVGVLVLVSGIATQQAMRPDEATPATTSSAGERLRMPCGPRELPEGAACVPIPLPPTSAGAPDEPAPDGDGDERGGARIPRRPDRPADVTTLGWPVDGEATLLEVPGAIGIGGDVDRSVLRLGAPRGTPVVVAPLVGQEGDVEVLAIERLPGRGLVVAALATTREPAASGGGAAGPTPGGARTPATEERWVLLFGGLDGAGPGLARGSKLASGGVVGFVGDGATPGEPHLRFEARRLRDVDPGSMPLARLVTDAESIAVDARNVLAPR